MEIVDVVVMVLVDVGRGRGGGCERGIPRKRSAAYEGDPPASHFSRVQRYELLNLAQPDDAVCPATSDSIRDPSPADSDTDADDEIDLQWKIQFLPTKNDADCGDTVEEFYCLVTSATSNKVNMDKVLQSVVVDASHTPYKNGNIIYLFILWELWFVFV